MSALEHTLNGRKLRFFKWHAIPVERLIQAPYAMILRGDVDAHGNRIARAIVTSTNLIGNDLGPSQIGYFSESGVIQYAALEEIELLGYEVE